MFKKSLFLFLLIITLSIHVSAQSDTLLLSLTDAIRIAQDSSLQAFRATNMYLASNYQYKEFLSRKLPTLNFATTPMSYNRSIQRQFDPQDSAYHFYESQSISSSANMSVNQNLTLTGGQLTIDANIDRLNNTGSAISYSTVPIRIGIQQSLFAYNSYKWEKKTAPLQFEIAKKTYINSREDIAMQTVGFFFGLLTAEKQLSLARKSLTDADTMYWMGKKRFENGSIEKTDLLTLQLDLVNSQSDVKTRINDYERARFQFMSYLNLPKQKIIKLIAPYDIPEIILEIEQVLQLAKTNNTDFMNIVFAEIQGQSNLERSIKGSRFTASVGASYGFNKSSENFRESFTNPNTQQQVNLNISIPIIDWGRGRNNRNLAKRTFEADQYQRKQTYMDLEQQFKLNVNEFNLQKEAVVRAQSAQDIADEAYETAQKRFAVGRIDVNAFSMQQTRKETANLNYLAQIQRYWTLYYQIRKNTLYDFEKKTSLSQDFDKINGME